MRTLTTRSTRSAPWAVFLTIALALLAALAGCSSDKGTGPNEGVSTGTYSLSRVDDDAPPVTIHQGPWLDPVNVIFYNKFIVQITGGSIELNDDDTFSVTFMAQVNGDGQQWGASLNVTGAYTIEDGEIWFYPDDENLNPVSSPLNGGAITLTIDFMGKGVANAYRFSK